MSCFWANLGIVLCAFSCIVVEKQVEVIAKELGRSNYRHFVKNKAWKGQVSIVDVIAIASKIPQCICLLCFLVTIFIIGVYFRTSQISIAKKKL